MSVRRARRKALQLHLGAVQGRGPNVLAVSVVASDLGTFVEVFAHNPNREHGGVVVTLDAAGYADLKDALAELDGELASGRFVLKA
jgi:hypothetical protein